ncbi:MAG: hypothetical protein AMS14_11850 [Planctomycetes bacterium DG_20]|nr:MAG: hypothetical protein AMS14_11850 [Planctomycetes bacterium DG_20]
MTFLRLTIKETVRRPVGWLLSLAAVTAATALYVAVPPISSAASDAMRKITLRLGHNVLMVPKGAPQDRLWATDFGEKTMPEEYIDRVAEVPDIEAMRYAALLERRIEIGGAVAVVTGSRFELGEYGRVMKKPAAPPGVDAYDVKRPDQAYLGAEIARRLKKKEGDTITLEGQTFRVQKVRPPEGTIDDIRIYIHLHRAQQMANKTGQINSLLAFGCICPVVRKGWTLMQTLRQKFDDHFQGVAAGRGLDPPDVIMLRDKFEARQESRETLAKMFNAVAKALLALCGLAMAIYMYSVVSRRRYEAALLISLGYRPWQVILGLVSKVLLVGVLGGLGGMLVGTDVAVVVAGAGAGAVEYVSGGPGRRGVHGAVRSPRETAEEPVR